MRLLAICPECGAQVPLVRDHWLRVHNVGSDRYVLPSAERPRCPGSFMPARQKLRATGEPLASSDSP